MEIHAPLVSISCITYNHSAYIRKALDSFLMQDCPFSYEILIHDDASTDKTADIIREYAARYPDIIRPLLQTENQYSKGIHNISGVFNFTRARGRYIAMCEGDDYWTDAKKLAKQAAYMEAHPEVSMCCHSAEIVSMDGAYREKSLIRPAEGDRKLSPREVIAKTVNFPTASLFFRTDDAKALPKWYFDCPVGDIPLHLFMQTKGEVYYMDSPMSAYRMGADGSWGAEMDCVREEERRRKWEAHFTAMQKLFCSFDADTEGRYREYVDEALARSRFLIDLKLGHFEAMLEEKNRQFQAELPRNQRLLLRLRAKHPDLYDGLRNLYFKGKALTKK